MHVPLKLFGDILVALIACSVTADRISPVGFEFERRVGVAGDVAVTVAAADAVAAVDGFIEIIPIDSHVDDFAARKDGGQVWIAVADKA